MMKDVNEDDLKIKRTCTDGRHTALDIFRFAVFLRLFLFMRLSSFFEDPWVAPELPLNCSQAATVPAPKPYPSNVNKLTGTEGRADGRTGRQANLCVGRLRHQKRKSLLYSNMAAPINSQNKFFDLSNFFFAFPPSEESKGVLDPLNQKNEDHFSIVIWAL